MLLKGQDHDQARGGQNWGGEEGRAGKKRFTIARLD
jgi:hypothetical protein